MNKKLEQKYNKAGQGGGRSEGQKVKIGRHKKGAWTEIGQNRIRGGWGVKKTQKTSDIIYVRSLSVTSCFRILVSLVA